MKKIYAWEPWFFMFFGLFHLHRIWGLIHRTSYADFWIGILESKGIFYFVLMGILAFLCVCGIVTFCKNIKNNYWWRWIYIFGGSYVLFDLFAIAIELKVWNDLLLFMFDVNGLYWNMVWGFFIALGAFVFCLGMKLLKQRKAQIRIFISVNPAERLDYKYYILRRLLFEKKQHLGDCGITGRL